MKFSEGEIMFDILELIFTVDWRHCELFNGTIKTRL